MSTQAGVGYSQNTKDSFAAGVDATKQALAKAGNEAIKLVIVLTTEQFDEAAVLSGIQSVVGNVPSIGCTAASVIANGQTYSDAISVAIIRSDSLKVTLSLSKDINGHAKNTGRQLGLDIAKQSGDGNEQNTILMFIDASQTKGVVGDVIDGAYEVLGTSYRFIGGGSSDNLHFKKSFQFLDGKIYQDAVVAACISSQNGQVVSLKHGWEPTGINMVVTKVDGKVVKEIDGSPALKVYIDMLKQDLNTFNFQEFYHFASAHPFGIPTGRGEYIIRDPLSANTEDQSINFISEVPENSIIRIMTGTPETLLAASNTAASKAKIALEGKIPALIFVADCVSRKLFLADQVQDELNNITSIGSSDTPMIGFFSLGEVGIEVASAPAFYNKTCALYVLGK